MIKKSKVTNVQGGGTWSPNNNPDKIFYGFEVEMENGDIGQYSSIKKEQDKFVVGQEVEYEFIDGRFPKVKPVYQKPQSFGGGSKDDPNRQIKIDKWAGLTRSMAWFTLMGIKPESDEQIYAKAQEWIDWVNDEPKQTSVKTHFENMEKNINDLPF
jgi:hypothetical protein|tara:strand:+ start:861 stop:1328 length:468 start_codon:yes stop_codon:yes gene_type:complete